MMGVALRHFFNPVRTQWQSPLPPYPSDLARHPASGVTPGSGSNNPRGGCRQGYDMRDCREVVDNRYICIALGIKRSRCEKKIDRSR